jgi:hypothetical protein
LNEALRGGLRAGGTNAGAQGRGAVVLGRDPGSRLVIDRDVDTANRANRRLSEYQAN